MFKKQRNSLLEVQNLRNSSTVLIAYCAYYGVFHQYTSISYATVLWNACGNNKIVKNLRALRESGLTNLQD